MACWFIDKFSQQYWSFWLLVVAIQTDLKRRYIYIPVYKSTKHESIFSIFPAKHEKNIWSSSGSFKMKKKIIRYWCNWKKVLIIHFYDWIITNISFVISGKQTFPQLEACSFVLPRTIMMLHLCHIDLPCGCRPYFQYRWSVEEYRRQHGVMNIISFVLFQIKYWQTKRLFSVQNKTLHVTGRFITDCLWKYVMLFRSIEGI